MRNGFAMPDLDSPLVADRQAWYLNRPDLLKRVFERSRRYLHHIVGELEKRGMPTELALLPMVESSFNPLAYSSARASGHVAVHSLDRKNYKLQQNWWFDQRRDIVASTSAALDYLQTSTKCTATGIWRWHPTTGAKGPSGRAIAKNQAKGLPTDYLQPEDAGRNALLRAQAAGDQEHHRPAATVRRQPRPDRPTAPISAPSSAAKKWTSPSRRGSPKFRWMSSSPSTPPTVGR
jgi:hypothetical protein